ncbi:MAG: orotate phosphoribosyltransferase [Balneola sp.]|nr:MAG: orotate phosphoribosyltransferase [Balneola sp.]
MIIDTTFARELASDLLEINAVILRPNDPFTWASGWHSPIYCDNRLTLRHPEIRKKIATKFSEIITQEFPNTEVITGTATAGIPHAAWVADLLNKPMAYVRAKPKNYGMGNQIEGGVAKGQPTVVIEDLISTGGSALSVINALQFVGADVQAIISIFNYGFDKSSENFESVNVPVFNLTDYSTLVDVAVEKGFVTSDDLDQLSNWRNNPDTWPNN